jgi:hypothetical protein
LFKQQRKSRGLSNCSMKYSTLSSNPIPRGQGLTH